MEFCNKPQSRGSRPTGWCKKNLMASELGEEPMERRGGSWCHPGSVCAGGRRRVPSHDTSDILFAYVGYNGLPSLLRTQPSRRSCTSSGPQMRLGQQEPGSFKDTHWERLQSRGQGRPELSDDGKPMCGARKLVSRQLSLFQSRFGRRCPIDTCLQPCVPQVKDRSGKHSRSVPAEPNGNAVYHRRREINK